MPLTRNQQAALQANGQGHVGSNDEADPHSITHSDEQPSSGMLSEASSGASSKTRDSNGNALSQEMASLNHQSASDQSDWVSTFASTGSSLSDDVFTHDSHPSAFDPSPSSSSVLFYRLQPGGGPNLAAQHQQVNHDPPPSPFYTNPQNEQQRHASHAQLQQQQEQHQRQIQQQQQQQQQRERSMTTNDTFLVGLQTQIAHLSPDKTTFENMPQRPSVFAPTSFHGDPPAGVANVTLGNEGRQSNASGLGPAFSTPQPLSRTGVTEAHHDHSRTYSLDRADPRSIAAMQRRGLTQQQQQQQQLMQLHRTPGSADSSMSMEMDNVEMLTHMSMQSASPLGHTISSVDAIAGMRAIERQQRSLGQVSAGMNQTHTPGAEGIFRLTNGNGPMRTIDTSSLEPFGMHPSATSQPNSPPEHSMHPMHGNRPTFLDNFSPVSSISHSRHMGDSSIDTSTGSISNSATTMSAVHSQASSISSDFLGGSKKGPKVKTRLRNIDRKAICEAARDDPRVRQEDLAVRFNIERSTVSKTLKNKEKWLAIEDDGQHAMTVKHRAGKFPALEARLAKWIQDEVGVSTPVLDITIKQRALQVAKELGIGMEQFKASVGWIDKFRERHGLPKFTASYATMSVDDDDIRTSSSGKTHDDKSLQDGGMATQSSGMPNQEDLASLYTSSTNSPPNGLVPTASTPQRPRSNSMERFPGAQETPKASKRQYDDMAMVSGDARSVAAQQSSIDAGMAHMHLPANLVGRGHAWAQTHEGEGKGPRGLTPHPHDDSGYAAGASKATSSVSSSAASACDDAGEAAPALSSAKRRKGRHDGAAGTFSDSSSGSAIDSRSHLRAAHSSNTISRSDSSRSVVVGSGDEMRHDREEQTQGTGDTALRRSLRHSVQASPSGYEGTSPTRPDLLGMMQSAEASSPMQSGSSVPSLSAMDDRPVTLEEARLSLEVVLAFFERQPTNLSRSDVFVLGNLQGQLSILANQQGHDAVQAEAAVAAVNAAVQQHSQQQEQRLHHLASRQQHEQHPQHQQPQHSGLNMLGITRGDMTLADEMDHHRTR